MAPAPKRVPAEVLEKAKAVATVTRKYTVAAPKPAALELPKKKPSREKVVAALQRLHPMD